MPISIIKKNERRLLEVDLLRFIAALSVVLYHYGFHAYQVGQTTAHFPFIKDFLKYGYLGVELFFIISGFVIALSADGRSSKQFIISRITRLYPVFWIGCTLTFIITFFFSSPLPSPTLAQYIVNMTMMQGLFSIPSIDGVYWTLTYELKFYAIILLLIIFKQFKNIEYMAIFWLIYSIAFAFNFKIKYIGLLFFPEYGVFFIAGIFFYLIKKEKYINIKHGIILFSTYILAIYNSCISIISIQKELNAEFSLFVIAAIITLFFALFIAISLDKFSFLKEAWLANLGGLTYPLYLIHAYIGYVILHIIGNKINNQLLLLGLTSFFLFTAYLIAKHIEKPLANFLKRAIS